MAVRNDKNRGGSKSHPNIGIFVDSSYSYGRQVLGGVARYANLNRRWNIVVDQRRSLDKNSIWPRFDAVICIGGMGHLFNRARDEYQHIIVCSGSGDPALSHVVAIDDYAVGEMAADHLMNCQLLHYGYYGYGKGSAFQPEIKRVAGYENRLESKSFGCIFCDDVRQSVISPTGWVDRTHHSEVCNWLRSLPKPIGIFCFDDNWANDLATICFHNTISVPEEVAILGVNNDDLLCNIAFPPLSSVDGGFERVGFSAAEQLDHLFLNRVKLEKNINILIPPLRIVRRQSTELSAINNLTVASAIRFIREHACDPCTVDVVARAVGVSRRWLERQFSASLGRTLHDEMRRIRIETAKRLLVETVMPVPIIAAHCGYAEIKGFYNAFTSIVDTTPAKYRQQSRKVPV